MMTLLGMEEIVMEVIRMKVFALIRKEFLMCKLVTWKHDTSNIRGYTMEDEDTVLKGLMETVIM